MSPQNQLNVAVVVDCTTVLVPQTERLPYSL